MKKTLLITFVTALVFSACVNNSGQTKSGGPDEDNASSIDKNLTLFKHAVKNGDNLTAIVALNYVLLEDSTLIQYKDSLARLYMLNGQFTPGIKLADAVLKVQPENDTLLEMVAQSKFQQGNFEASAADFKTLFDRLGKIDYLYQLAAIDFYTQNLTECMNKTDQLLKSPKVDSAVVDIMTQDGGVQRIGLRAAAHYVRGMVHIAKQNAPAANNELRKALQIEPDFQNAQLQYQMVLEYQQNQAKQEEYLKAQKKLQQRFGN